MVEREGLEPGLKRLITLDTRVKRIPIPSVSTSWSGELNRADLRRHEHLGSSPLSLTPAGFSGAPA